MPHIENHVPADLLFLERNSKWAYFVNFPDSIRPGDVIMLNHDASISYRYTHLKDQVGLVLASYATNITYGAPVNPPRQVVVLWPDVVDVILWSTKKSKVPVPEI